jgi:drug/metabolite transporter (DMT)-like permease
MVLLGALWGGSFLFMRIAAPAFGPVPLIMVRVVIAAVLLSLFLAARGKFRELRGRATPLLVVGAVNTAIPFSLFAYAAEQLGAGMAAILNATVPLLGAAVAWVWFRERLSRRQAIGLGVGFLGVVLVADGNDLRVDGPAVAGALLAALAYAIATHYIRRTLRDVDPLAIATGSLLGATLVLLGPALLLWPTQSPPPSSWAAAVVLGIACTALAYILYFRLLASVGATSAMTVAYLIPLFGVLWGSVFLGEQISWSMIAGGGGILAGVAIVTRSARLPSAAGPVVSSPSRL